MDCLRHKRESGRSALQTPVITLADREHGRRGTLVLTAHLGEAEYFERLREIIDGKGAPVFYESIRSRDDSEAHWRERHHRFLRRLRRDVYNDMAGLGLFAFQGEHLAPENGWRNADVDCCQFADKLRERHVSMLKYDLAIGALQRMVRKAKTGNEDAARMLQRMFQLGLLLVSVSYVFEAVNLIPSSRRFQQVANDWRNTAAAKTVLDSGVDDFVLVYGAAHGPGLLKLLGKAGYEETGREWLTVFRL